MAAATIVERITLTAFRQHTRPLGRERTRRAVRVDPGEADDQTVESVDGSGPELRVGVNRKP